MYMYVSKLYLSILHCARRLRTGQMFGRSLCKIKVNLSLLLRKNELFFFGKQNSVLTLTVHER